VRLGAGMIGGRRVRARVGLRLILGLGVSGALAGLTGCHHNTATVYAPPAASAPTVSRTVRPAEPMVVPMEIPAQSRLVATEVGLASWYGRAYENRRSADGTVYDGQSLTAASRTLPLGALVRVTNLVNGQVAVVRINDRGPFVPGRIIDLSEAAARAAGLYRLGVAKVRVEAYLPQGFAEVVPRWCVQVGAFTRPEDAEDLREFLMLQYPRAKVISFQGPTGSWVRLTLPVPDEVSTNQVAAQLRVPEPDAVAYLTRTN
jgi:rare lipoprotein A